MNTFIESTVEPEGGQRPVLRYMVFATDNKPQADTLGGFQYDHDDLEYIMNQLREEALSTAYTRFEIFDTQTFQTHVIEVTSVKERMYRVILKWVPVEKRENVVALLTTLMGDIRPRDIPYIVQTCPSFIKQRTTKAEAQRVVDECTALGASAYVEEETEPA